MDAEKKSRKKKVHSLYYAAYVPDETPATELELLIQRTMMEQKGKDISTEGIASKASEEQVPPNQIPIDPSIPKKE
ncbi:hypothetical protein GPJ56_005990 [Histomonas meleagridis]|uniref:uncharacterized protein n=1 Tax=Histomonas meleagridis TaxID=135588 RepID=UPI0035596ADA|nr:hypothetical protein GPJ56_005990 [Histomonas meleagridis]KAH0799397.1 hypothetical protein GO595_007798 [Histomonas meleagridis]